jgi:hypothetical protein
VSTHWQIRCADCNVTADDPRINHGQAILRDMIALGRHLATLPGEDQIDYELRLFGWYLPMRFFREHGPHHLALISEYGDGEEVARPLPVRLAGQEALFAEGALQMLVDGVADLAFRIDATYLDGQGRRVITKATPLSLTLRRPADG